jgi:hypothetical protein
VARQAAVPVSQQQANKALHPTIYNSGLRRRVSLAFDAPLQEISHQGTIYNVPMQGDVELILMEQKSGEETFTISVFLLEG